jgi:hypothetical protein
VDDASGDPFGSTDRARDNGAFEPALGVTDRMKDFEQPVE